MLSIRIDRKFEVLMQPGEIANLTMEGPSDNDMYEVRDKTAGRGSNTASLKTTRRFHHMICVATPKSNPG